MSWRVRGFMHGYFTTWFKEKKKNFISWPTNPLECLTSNFSFQYHPWVKHYGNKNIGKDHRVKRFLIVEQILFASTIGNVWRTVWRICILMFGWKGLTKGENYLPVYTLPISWWYFYVFLLSSSLSFPTPSPSIPDPSHPLQIITKDHKTFIGNSYIKTSITPL